MTDDLKNFKANAFQLISEETAATLLLLVFALVLILDRFGVFAQ